MKVRELIEQLSKVDAELDAVIDIANTEERYDIESAQVVQEDGGESVVVIATGPGDEPAVDAPEERDLP